MVAALSLSSVSFAQGGGQGGPGGGGQRMMMRGGFGGGAASEAMLLQRTDVQKDIKLTPEQLEKLKAVQTAMQEKMRTQFGGGQRGAGAQRIEGTPPPPPAEGAAGIRSRENFNPDQMRGQFEAMQKEATDKAKEIVTPEQWTRLGQIKVQLAGPRIVIDDQEIGKKVGVKASQKIEINKLLESLQQANMQIMMKMREPNANREALGAELTKNDQILRDEVKKILTADQLNALAELEGPKFVADLSQSQMRFGAGGGRNGGGGAGRKGGTGGGRGGIYLSP